MKGRFVVIEGVNGAGKTTILKNALPELESAGCVYSKGFTNSSLCDTLIHRNPHSFVYYTVFAIKTGRQIRPLLADSKIVLQDRYVQSVDSYIPDSEWIHNRLLRQLFSPFFLAPDLYFHITASIDEVVGRLARDARDNYRMGLVKNPWKIKQREERYREIFDEMRCPKHILDTTGRDAEDCAQELGQIVRRELKCL